METALDTTALLQSNSAPAKQNGSGTTSPLHKKAGRTRHGKVKLLTLDDLDRRTAARRSFAALNRDLGDDPSTQQQWLRTRAVMTDAMAKDFETRWAAGEQIPILEYLATVNTHRRCLRDLGLERRAKDVTPDPLTYAREQEHEQVP